jgi:1-acyl-sn-glycerol-3-phosphate acyltransferase
MRNVLFQAAYWTTSVIVALLSVPLLLWPGRKPLMAWIRLYSRTMVYWMRTIAGIELDVRGRGRVPEGASIIAAKHQSWGDGFCMFAQFDDLAFITGDHLEKIPLLRHILRKIGAIVVASCGGVESRARLTSEGIASARTQGRPILIYPEGRLVAVGHYMPYKKGIYHMYQAYGCPVVPVATNLGLFWPKDEWNLRSGTAVVEFLEPIPPGMEKDAFMQLLHDRIETASLALLPRDYPVPEVREIEHA